MPFDLNWPASVMLKWNYFSEKTTANNILSNEVENWLKHDEAKFITTLEANEGSNIEWRVFATYQLDYSQPLLSLDMS